MRVGGRIWTVTTTHSAGPAGFHTSWTLLWVTRFLIRPGFLVQLFVIGEDDKSVFSTPDDIIRWISPIIGMGNWHFFKYQLKDKSVLSL